MGEIADEMINRMLWGHGKFDEYGEYYGERPRSNKTATEVAEELSDESKTDKARKLNEGVIKW